MLLNDQTHIICSHLYIKKKRKTKGGCHEFSDSENLRLESA